MGSGDSDDLDLSFLEDESFTPLPSKEELEALELEKERKSPMAKLIPNSIEHVRRELGKGKANGTRGAAGDLPEDEKDLAAIAEAEDSIREAERTLEETVTPELVRDLAQAVGKLAVDVAELTNVMRSMVEVHSKSARPKGKSKA